MRLACPSCSAAYEIPDRMLTAGRTLRCARCGHQWPHQAADQAEEQTGATPPHPEPVAATPEPPPPPPTPLPAALPMHAHAAQSDADHAPAEPLPDGPTAFTAMDRLGLTSRPLPETNRTALRAAWAASILVLILAGAAAYSWRDGMMRVWPPSQRVYAALGLSVAHATTDAPAEASPNKH